MDVYNITNGGLVHLSSNCSVLSPSYTFTVENPDPKDEFEFTITPRSNVEGAKNGTLSRIIGRFSLQSKLLVHMNNSLLDEWFYSNSIIKKCVMLT